MARPTPLFADISSNNAGFNAVEYRDAGHVIVAIKATEGTFYTNPEHRPWCYAAGSQRVAIIHYHFARPDLGSTPEAEADYFLEVALPLAGGRDYLALDMERAVRGNWSRDPSWSKSFAYRVSTKSRFKVKLYASRSLLQTNPVASEWLPSNPAEFWDADYGLDHDYAPEGGVCIIRQQSGVTAGPPPYSLPGVGPCDVDVARGLFWREVLNNSR